MRPRQPRQRRDLAGGVHADLDHREVAVRRHPRQRQRHAPVVVEALLRGMDAALRRRARRGTSPWSRSCRPSRSPRRRGPRSGPAPRARARAAPRARPARREAAHPPPPPRAAARPAPPPRPSPAPRRRSRARPAPRSARRRDRPARASACRSRRRVATQSRALSPPVAATAASRVQSPLTPPPFLREWDGVKGGEAGRALSARLHP